MPGMSKHHQPHTKPFPERVAEPGEPLPEVPAEAYPPDSVALPETPAFAAEDAFTQAQAPIDRMPSVRAHAARVAARADLVTELGALPASNDLVAIQSNAGAGYYADKHDHLVADLNALTFDDAAALAQRDALVQRLSAGSTK
jgi:hypothetical protein